jgi:hypothetical protein
MYSEAVNASYLDSGETLEMPEEENDESEESYDNDLIENYENVDYD